MAAISRPVVYGALGFLVIAVLVWVNGEPEKISKKPPVQKSVGRKAEPDWNFPATETSIHFEKPKGTLRNIFAPLIGVEKVGPKTEADQLMKVPASLAAGEADWTYTGMVEVDGVRMALLENASKHQGGYVKEGDTWKKSQVAHITLASIDVVGPDGIAQTVFRYNPNATSKPKPQPDGGFRPMDLSQALNGPIGMQITPDAAESDAPASPRRKK